MGSRLYFPFTTAAAVSPATESSWASAAGLVRRYLAPKPSGDNSTGHRGIPAVATGNFSGVTDQYVSDPIPADFAISGTFSTIVHGRPNISAVNRNGRLRVIIKVVSNNGSTLRGILYDGLSGSVFAGPNGNSEYTKTVAGTLNLVSVLAGDRIVVERGIQWATQPTAVENIIFRAGDRYQDSDMAFQSDVEVFGGDRSWIEFSQDNIWGTPKLTVAGMTTLVGEKPSRTPLRIAGVSAAIGEKPARTPLRLAGISVNALIPRAGQTLERVVAAGFPNTEPRVKLPDGRWVALRPPPKAQRDRPIVTYSNFSLNRGVSVDQLPAENEFMVFMTSTKEEIPKGVLSSPQGIPGATWTEAYRSLDDRHVVWFGTGATATGTATFSAQGSDAANTRASAVYIVKGAKKNISYVRTGRTTDATKVFFTPGESYRDQVMLLTAMGNSASPDPTVVKPDDWVLYQQDAAVTMAKANPLASVAGELSVAHATGVSGAMVSVGGDTAYEEPLPGIPIPSTTRYYFHSSAQPVTPPLYSSQWDFVDGNYTAGLSKVPGTQGAWSVLRQGSVPLSGAALMAVGPALPAGVIAGSFRLVWPVRYNGTAYLRVIARLMSKNGLTERGMLADVTDDISVNNSTTSYTTRTVSSPLTPLVAQRGDRIVFELGFLFSSGVSSAGGQQSVAAGPDDYSYADNIPYVSSSRGWLELIPN